MSTSKTLATGADWTQLIADPDLVSHLGKLLKICREAAPDKREKALFEAIREIKQGAATKTKDDEVNIAVATPPAPQPQEVAAKTTPPFEADDFTPFSMTEDRRRHPRMKCFVAVELRVGGSETPIWGNLANTSKGGCLVQTSSVVDTGKKIEIGLWVANGKLWVKGVILNGVVTGAKSSEGIRIKFSDMEPAEREALHHFLKFIENTTKSYQQTNGYLAQMKR